MKIALLSLVAGFLLSGCGQGDAKPESSKESSTGSGNPLTAPADYIGAAGKGKATAARTVELVGLRQSIQLFYAQEGRYPKDLNELVKPDYLSGGLPKAPAGKKFKYDPRSGEVTIVPAP